MIFQNEKTPFQAIKTRSSKSRKIDIFANGLTHGFCPKLPFFQVFFFANIGQEIVFYHILETKNAFLAYKNNKFKKLKKLSLFRRGPMGNRRGPEGNPWFWSKHGHFSNFYFQPIQARKMSFMIFQNEKTPLKAKKTRSSKSRKIDIFPKGLTHGFFPKMAIFLTFFLGIIGQEIVFYDILETKIAFLGYKNNKLKKVEKLTFSQRG